MRELISRLRGHAELAECEACHDNGTEAIQKIQELTAANERLKEHHDAAVKISKAHCRLWKRAEAALREVHMEANKENPSLTRIAAVSLAALKG